MTAACWPLIVAALHDDQLWYVAHSVHPTDEEIAAFRVGPSGGVQTGYGFVSKCTDREVSEMIIRDNIANAKLWLAWLIRRFPTITFIAPWIAALDGGGDDDLDPVQRDRGLRDCCRTIRVCSGMVCVGGRVSGGMSKEATYARSVIDLTSLGREPPADSHEVGA